MYRKTLTKQQTKNATFFAKVEKRKGMMISNFKGHGSVVDMGKLGQNAEK